MTSFTPGNQVKLLHSGAEYFPALVSALDGARLEVFLETYLFADDDAGRQVAAALARAARRGAAVHVLMDGFGCRAVAEPLLAEMYAAGVHVLHFRPETRLFDLSRSRLRRLHRKLVVIDGETAFVGGINVIDDMNTPGHTPPRYDYAFQVRGPLLAEIHAAARRLWALISWSNRVQPPRPLPAGTPVTAPAGGVRAAFVVRDNLRHRRAIEEAYLEAIDNARTEIVIANAYFLPGWNFRHALLDAAGRGVRVVLLLQAQVEYRLLHYASRALYGQLLDGGVEIWEYHKSFMHAKVAVIDRRWATVGSSNIDPFSLLLSREANVVVNDTGLAAELRQDLFQHMAEGGRKVCPAGWQRRHPVARLRVWLSYGLVRFLMGMVGYGREARR